MSEKRAIQDLEPRTHRLYIKSRLGVPVKEVEAEAADILRDLRHLQECSKAAGDLHGAIYDSFIFRENELQRLQDTLRQASTTPARPGSRASTGTGK